VDVVAVAVKKLEVVLLACEKVRRVQGSGLHGGLRHFPSWAKISPLLTSLTSLNFLTVLRLPGFYELA
jgi:hypothetical protein